MIKKFFTNATFILIILVSNSLVFSQDLDIKIKVASSEKVQVLVEGEFLSDKKIIERNWSFVQNYADAEGLAKRIKNLKLLDKNKNRIPYKKIANGEYVADKKVFKFSYDLDARPQQNTTANAHVSWVGKTNGLLMLGDLLPMLKDKSTTVRVSFVLPARWKVSSAVMKSNFSREKLDGSISNVITLNLESLENAVLFIGEDWREKNIFVNKTNLKFIILDKWQFKDELAFKMAEEITKEYADLFGELPVKNAQIILMGFPKKMAKGRWRAETRGANITILSSQAFAESFAKQRLHEQLRHEIFHLWIPNSLNLSGDYAWFYEGFAIYQALKTGVKLGQIRFEDFLNTLEQAYFLEQKRRNTNSLLNLSKMRWNGEISSVYAKGLLVAFLCDSLLLEKSKGKRDLKVLFREIYQNYKQLPEKKDANESILNVLKKRKELVSIINKYIKGKDKIDWTNHLTKFGIENAGTETNVNLKVGSKLSGRQKALLKKLGYNNR